MEKIVTTAKSAERDTDEMVQCDVCDQWYNFGCVGVSSEVTNVSWSCEYCKGASSLTLGGHVTHAYTPTNTNANVPRSSTELQGVNQQVYITMPSSSVTIFIRLFKEYFTIYTSDNRYSTTTTYASVHDTATYDLCCSHNVVSTTILMAEYLPNDTSTHTAEFTTKLFSSWHFFFSYSKPKNVCSTK